MYAAQAGEVEARAAEIAVERLRAQLAQQTQKVAQERAAPAIVRAASAPAAAPAPAPAAAPAPVVSEAYAAAPEPLDAYEDYAQEEPAEVVEEEQDYAYDAQEAVAAAPAFVAPARQPQRVVREEAYQSPYAADAPPPRTMRMPTIEELPRPAQEQLRQARGEANQAEARRRSLFERIAAFGASRQEEAYEAAAAQPPAAPRPVRAQPPQAPQPSPMHAEYAKRASAQANAAAMRASADPQVRRPAPPRNVEDDNLEIPAFLRRQAHR
jgi:cell division protein FtsZ